MDTSIPPDAGATEDAGAADGSPTDADPPAAGHLRVASFNVNGIRACVRRGYGEWVARRQPDIVALQEMRSPASEVPADSFAGYHLAYHPGELAGRNGVAIASRVAPTDVRIGTGSREFDSQGRYVEVDLTVDDRFVTVGSVYVPKGGVLAEDPERYERKQRFFRHFGRYLTDARRAAAREGREFLVLGDWNVAPTEYDVDNARAKVRSEGFLPEERAWIDRQMSPRTLIDVVRRLRPQEQGPYSWWSWRGQQWTLDRGWRIDYHLATPALAAVAVAGGTDREPTYEARMSDHSPVVVDYDLTLLPGPTSTP